MKIQQILTFILTRKYCFFSKKELRDFFQGAISDELIKKAIEKFIEQKTISPIGIKKGIYRIEVKEYKYEDNYKLALLLEPEWVLSFRTSFVYFDKYENKIPSFEIATKSSSKIYKNYHYKWFGFYFNSIKEDLFYQWTQEIKEIGRIYIPEKALLDLLYIESKQGKNLKQFDFKKFFLNKLDYKKLFNLLYNLNYPKTIRVFIEEKFWDKKWQEYFEWFCLDDFTNDDGLIL